MKCVVVAMRAVSVLPRSAPRVSVVTAMQRNGIEAIWSNQPARTTAAPNFGIFSSTVSSFSLATFACA